MGAFCFLSSFTPALPLFNTIALSPLTQHGNPFKQGAPGQFPLPSFAACHVVYSAQLFKKCWISTMAFTGALSTFVWSNLGWMRWVPEQGELSCSVHYHTSNWLALLLFIFLCCTGSCHGGGTLVWMVMARVWAVDVTAIFLLLLTANCWKCVWQRDWEAAAALGPVRVWWVSSIFWPEWEEVSCEERRDKREGGFRKTVQGAVGGVVWVMFTRSVHI